MTTTTKTILTTYGNNRILDAIANDTTVPITAIAYGDGDYGGLDPTVDQTELLDQLGRLTSVSKEFNETEGFIYFKATIPANANEGQAFTLTEFGLLDDQNKLLTVTTIPGIEKPATEDGVSIALPISIGFKTSTGEIMVIYENGTDVYANTSLSNLNNTGEHHFDDTYATVDLDNLSLTGERHFLGRTHITNCVTEIPQKINYTLENGTLTIKAGSVFIVPFGTNNLSTTYSVGTEFLNSNFLVEDTQYSSGKFFVWARLQSDMTTTWNQGTYDLSVFIDPTNNTLVCYNRQTDASGTSPNGTVTYFNTSTNYIQRYSSGTASGINLSLPILRISSNASQITAITEELNGINHMGNTIIIDKNVRLLIPNGRNTNGSLNNIAYITENLLIQSGISLENNKEYTYFYNYSTGTVECWLSSACYEQSVNESISTDRVYYDFATNSYTQYISSTQYNNLYCQLGKFTSKITYISNFKQKYAFRAVDFNDFLDIKATINSLRTDIATAQNTANTANTTANSALAKANTSVQLSGDQTISGKKTFNSIYVPNSTSIGSALRLNRRATGVYQDGSGLLIQWGEDDTKNHTKTVSLSYAYSSKTAYKALVCDSGSTNNTVKVKVQTQETKKFVVYTDSSSSGESFHWITIGYGSTS